MTENVYGELVSPMGLEEMKKPILCPRKVT